MDEKGGGNGADKAINRGARAGVVSSGGSRPRKGMEEVGHEWASVETSLGLAGGLTDGKNITVRTEGIGESNGGSVQGERKYIGPLGWLVGAEQGHGIDRTPERTTQITHLPEGNNLYGHREGPSSRDVSITLSIYPFILSLNYQPP